MTNPRPREAKVVLRDSKSREILAGFETVKEAIEYAEEHDLKCFIDITDIVRPN